MGYVEQNLTSGEQIMHRAKLHWIVLVVPCLIAAFFGLIAISIIADPRADNTTAAILFLVAAACVGFALPRRSSSEFTVTNRRIVLKTGVVRHKTAELFVNKVESVAVSQGLLGRALGYGTIVLRGTGGSFEPFKGIANPLEFRRQVQAQIEKTHGAANAGSD